MFDYQRLKGGRAHLTINVLTINDSKAGGLQRLVTPFKGSGFGLEVQGFRVQGVDLSSGRAQHEVVLLMFDHQWLKRGRARLTIKGLTINDSKAGGCGPLPWTRAA